MDRVLSTSPLKLRKMKMERVVALLSQVIEQSINPAHLYILTGNNADTGIGMSPEELRTNLVRLYCTIPPFIRFLNQISISGYFGKIGNV